MKMFKGQLAEWGAVEVARYRSGNFQLICKTYNGFYFITFHNGRQTSVTRYTDNKNEANEYVQQEIRKNGYKRV